MQLSELQKSARAWPTSPLIRQMQSMALADHGLTERQCAQEIVQLVIAANAANVDLDAVAVRVCRRMARVEENKQEGAHA